jgi:hypothetical protein
MTQEDLPKLLRFFKVMADESRLRILGLLSSGEHSVDEVAKLLGVKPPTVSHHLAKLKELDLVSMRIEGTSHVYRLRRRALTELSRDLLTERKLSDLADGLHSERKIVRDFVDGDAIRIPAARKKREVLLRWLAKRFERGVRYSEKEVDRILGLENDFFTLRRELVGYRLLAREKGVYWRL